MIRNSKAFTVGILLSLTFFIILFAMFMPWYGGENALRASDRLFNSISKASADYIPGLQKKTQGFAGTSVNLNLKLKDANMAEKAVKLLTTAGAQATAQGPQLKTSGDLGKILGAALADSGIGYEGKGPELQDLNTKYQIAPREVLLVWWNILKDADRELKTQSKFKEAAFVADVEKKGVEVGYNYFGIAPKSAAENWGILSGSLIFYVIYTLWWGIAVLFLFEGIGLEMKAGAKKEM
jgi:hypothetical protein